MQDRLKRMLILLCGLFAACAAAPQRADAGIIADTWYALFGPPGTPYFPGAYGGYYGARTYRVSYSGGYAARSRCCRPVQVCYPRVCVPCNPCVPTCPSPCSPCEISGPCRVSDSTLQNGTTNSSAPRTFRKTPGDGIQPPNPNDSKWQPRKDSKKLAPEKTGETKKSSDNDSPFPTPADDDTGDANGTKHKTLKVPSKDSEKSSPGIGNKKPAPAKPPVEDNKEDKQQTLDLPDFSRTITWKPVRRRTRLVIHGRLQPRQLARTTVDPNSRWQPIERGSQIARK